MTESSYDIAIVGSGFAGSILAMIARRLGYSVILIEKGRHPRFVIGESTTPITNLLLEELARRYDLPRLLPLCEWGSWQRTYPHLACGLKRGFSFYHHRFDHEFEFDPEHRNQLLVAASPRNELADTHWYRPDFDHFLVQEAVGLGVDYRPETVVQALEPGSDQTSVIIQTAGKAEKLRVGLLVDSTGPRGGLDALLGGSTTEFEAMPRTHGLYTHFTGVRRSVEVCDPLAGGAPPYPPDDAALHHVFPGGWIWVLPFNNGITSAGVAATAEVAKAFNFQEGQPAWDRLLARLPSVKKQFAQAQAVLPFVHAHPLSFRRANVAGQHWLRLPSAAGFSDPLLSTGFPLSLLGIKRVAGILEKIRLPIPEPMLEEYARATLADLDWAAQLVGALYSNMDDFESFAAVSLLYFAAAASFTETAIRLGRQSVCGNGFLLRENEAFRTAAEACLRSATGPGKPSAVVLKQQCLAALAPFDIAGLGRPERRNWHPVEGRDLLEGAVKIGVSRTEVVEFLERFGIEVGNRC